MDDDAELIHVTHTVTSSDGLRVEDTIPRFTTNDPYGAIPEGQMALFLASDTGHLARVSMKREHFYLLDHPLINRMLTQIGHKEQQ